MSCSWFELFCLFRKPKLLLVTTTTSTTTLTTLTNCYVGTAVLGPLTCRKKKSLSLLAAEVDQDETSELIEPSRSGETGQGRVFSLFVTKCSSLASCWDWDRAWWQQAGGPWPQVPELLPDGDQDLHLHHAHRHLKPGLRLLHPCWLDHERLSRRVGQKEIDLKPEWWLIFISSHNKTKLFCTLYSF